jgi:hypothetical protein
MKLTSFFQFEFFCLINSTKQMPSTDEKHSANCTDFIPLIIYTDGDYKD